MIKITNDPEDFEKLQEYGNNIEYEPFGLGGPGQDSNIPIQFGEDALYYLCCTIKYENISEQDFEDIINSFYEPKIKNYYDYFNDFKLLSELNKFISSVEKQKIKPVGGYIINVYHSSDEESFHYEFGKDNSTPVFLFDEMDISSRKDIKRESYIEARPEFFRGLSLIKDGNEEEIEKIKISGLDTFVDEWNLKIIYKNGENEDIINILEYSKSFNYDEFIERLMEISRENINLSKYMIPGLKGFIEIPIKINSNGINASFISIIEIAE